MGDLTVQSLHYALDGLSARQQAIAQNVANSQTPGYTATTVDFEGQLQQALQSGQAAVTLSPSVVGENTPVGTNGNNVDLSTELTNDQNNTLQYQAVVDALKQKFQYMTDAMQ